MAKKTNGLVDSPIWTLWSFTNKIEIVGPGKYSGSPKKYVCYKQKLFDEQGWCYVHPMRDSNGLIKKNNWGFCGSSCELMEVKDTTPKIYHKLIWEYPPKHPSQCQRYTNIQAMPYYICESTFIPHTSIFKFRRSKRKNVLKFLEAYNEEMEDTFNALDENELENIGYQESCKGDSGSGHWMYDARHKRRALVAVTSHGYYNCIEPGFSLLTTHPNVLEWIKKYSDIRK